MARRPRPPRRARRRGGAASSGRCCWCTWSWTAARYTPFDAHYLPGGTTPVTRVSEPQELPRRRRPARHDRAVRRDPVRRRRRAVAAPTTRHSAAVAVAGLVRGRPTAARRSRASRSCACAHAYPVLRAGFEDHLARLDAWAAAQPALLTLGRQGLFVHDNAHHALAMAWAAVDCLRPGGGFDDGRLGGRAGRASRPTSWRTEPHPGCAGRAPRMAQRHPEGMRVESSRVRAAGGATALISR